MTRGNPAIAKLKTGKKSSEGSSFFINPKIKPGYLSLSDGKIFRGQLVRGPKKIAAGEVVFNTGMTGYVESLTDPSYAGQLLVFTYPLIGNYGVQPMHGESPRIQVSGVIVSEASRNWSHSAAATSLDAWLAAQDVPILSAVDTRALTKHLRTGGTMQGAIGTKVLDVSALSAHFEPFSVHKPKLYNRQHSKKIIMVDCGAKNNILRSLLELPLQIKLVPHDYDYTNEDYDGVLISNGPGDPIDYKKTIKVAASAFKKSLPMFGICLGSQIMALAAGAKTYKLLFGHRGHNQPCIDLGGKCFITSQNHGYAIDEKSLPSGWRVSFRNLNDGSVEGIEHRTKPLFSVQFHPEACPGPTDTKWLFERFYQLI